jgi:hypothetical protein
MARPRKELTKEQIDQVEKLAAVLNQDQLADFLGMSPRTFRERMTDTPEVSAAYKKGRSAGVASVATGLLKQARDGNTTAAIFYLKTQAGWREKDTLEVTGADGGDLTMTITRRIVDPANGE